ncbi:MAG TPA: hypothetical protein VNG12_20825 [Acidimicrobiales bacterium]|nr:hypothetical protein [Acidimicrobiales bacterium]
MVPEYCHAFALLRLQRQTIPTGLEELQGRRGARHVARIAIGNDQLFGAKRGVYDFLQCRIDRAVQEVGHFLDHHRRRRTAAGRVSVRRHLDRAAHVVAPAAHEDGRRFGPAHRHPLHDQGHGHRRVAAYLRHHLALREREEPLFTDDAVARLYRVSNGLPRALNNAATDALIPAAADGKDLIDDACAKKAVAELTRADGGRRVRQRPAMVTETCRSVITARCRPVCT